MNSFPPEPLPFRLGMAGEDTVDSRGARSVSYKVDGMLHLEGDSLTLEWAVDKTTENVGLGGISTDVEKFDYEEITLHLTWLTEARLTGGFMSPRRLRLRARRLDAFDEVPGARPGRIALRIRRRDRHIAAAMVAAIREARIDALEYTDPELLAEGDNS